MIHTEQRIETKLFQFHKGTIKTSLKMFLSMTLKSNFNSIKVRLKLIFCVVTLPCHMNFNSIKVRLKPVKSKAYTPRRLYRFAGAKIQKNLQKNVDA